MTLEDALEEIERKKRRDEAYLKILDEHFQPGRKKTRLKNYYGGRLQVLNLIKEKIEEE